MDWNRLRYLEGENLGWTGEERVALGGLDRRDGTMRWYDLTNVHKYPQHNFAIDGEQVAEVIQQAADELVQVSILWHSHEAQEMPSEMDIAMFPHWLSVGVVFAATSMTSASYDRTGFISLHKPSPNTTTDTEETS